MSVRLALLCLSGVAMTAGGFHTPNAPRHHAIGRQASRDGETRAPAMRPDPPSDLPQFLSHPLRRRHMA